MDKKNTLQAANKLTCLISPIIPNSISTNFVLAGTSSGIFISKDKADSWATYNEGLTDFEASAIAYGDVLLSYNIIATYSNNVTVLWKRPLSELTQVSSLQYSHEFSKQELLINNSILQYTITQSTSVSIRVFDMRGRLILSDKLSPQGIGEHSYSLAKLKALTGNYILEFTAGQNVTRKAFAMVR